MISITFLMLGAQNVRAEAREEDKTRSSLVPLTFVLSRRDSVFKKYFDSGGNK